MIELLKQERIERKMGFSARMGVAFGGAGGVVGALVGSGVLSGVGAVVGGSSGYLIGNKLS